MTQLLTLSKMSNKLATSRQHKSQVLNIFVVYVTDVAQNIMKNITSFSFLKSEIVRLMRALASHLSHSRHSSYEEKL